MEKIIFGIAVGIIILSILKIILTVVSNKKPDILSIIFIIITSIYFVLSNKLTINILYYLLVLLVMLVIITLREILITINRNNEKTLVNQTIDLINQSDTDYFILLNDINNIIKVSNTINHLTKNTLKDLSLETIFGSLRIISINSKEILNFDNQIQPVIEEILDTDDNITYDLCILLGNDEVKYRMSIDIIKNNNKLLGKFITIQKDYVKMLIENEVEKQDINELLQKNNYSIHCLMNLANDLGLYYDYQTKMYYTTKLFTYYTNLKNQFLNFNELLELIDKDDKDKYLRDLKYVNSASPLRMKYHLIINGVTYLAIEDAMYINDSNSDLLSTIHIYVTNNNLDKEQEILSSTEVKSILDEIVDTPVDSLITDTKRILNKSLIIDDKE